MLVLQRTFRMAFALVELARCRREAAGSPVSVGQNAGVDGFGTLLRRYQQRLQPCISVCVFASPPPDGPELRRQRERRLDAVRRFQPAECHIEVRRFAIAARARRAISERLYPRGRLRDRRTMRTQSKKGRITLALALERCGGKFADKCMQLELCVARAVVANAD
jgi:hypothetical protein